MNSASVFWINASGTIGGSGGVYVAGGIRPVINLRSDVELTGTGTSTDPYVVVS